MNYGLKLEPRELDQYIFGSGQLGGIPLQPDGQWDDFLPVYEPQAEKFETWGCTIWGTQNALEILHKRIFGEEINADERYNYNDIEIKPPGADPHKAGESIRKNGLTFGEYPMTETYQEFCLPRPVDIKKGQKWLKDYSFGHDWVNQDIKEALKYSPIGVGVSAWTKTPSGIYIANGEPNHWCVCYGWTDKGWKIFDSYDHSRKIYSADIKFAKRYFLSRNTKPQLWFIEMFRDFVWFIKEVIMYPFKY